MAMVTLTSGSTHFRDASFSSYLNSSEEAFVRRLVDSSMDHNPHITAHSDNFIFGRRKKDGGEIGVFGAEKYFNEGMDEDGPRLFKSSDTTCNYAEDGGVYTVPMKAESHPRAPSVYSEQSSWNSHSALLKSILRKPPPHKRTSKGLLTSIRCINCSCNKSVDIGEKSSKRNLSLGVFKGKEETIKIGMNSNSSAPINKAELNPLIMRQIQSRKIDETERGLRTEDGFSFPVLNSKPGNFDLHLQELENRKQNNSLNVFGSPIVERRNLNAGLEELDKGMYNHDTDSDASSDLFEIDDFKNNGKDLFLVRNASDGMSSYAPSEASIEWSIVTASAADFEDLVPSPEAARAYKMSSNGKHGGGKEMEKQRSGILSGCKSHKAVLVAGDAHRTSGKSFPDSRMPCRSDSFRRATRFQAEARRTSFDAINRPCSFSAGASSS